MPKMIPVVTSIVTSNHFNKEILVYKELCLYMQIGMCAERYIPIPCEDQSCSPTFPELVDGNICGKHPGSQPASVL